MYKLYIRGFYNFISIFKYYMIDQDAIYIKKYS